MSVCQSLLSCSSTKTNLWNCHTESGSVAYPRDFARVHRKGGKTCGSAAMSTTNPTPIPWQPTLNSTAIYRRLEVSGLELIFGKIEITDF